MIALRLFRAGAGKNQRPGVNLYFNDKHHTSRPHQVIVFKITLVELRVRLLYSSSECNIHGQLEKLAVFCLHVCPVGLTGSWLFEKVLLDEVVAGIHSPIIYLTYRQRQIALPLQWMKTKFSCIYVILYNFVHRKSRIIWKSKGGMPRCDLWHTFLDIFFFLFITYSMFLLAGNGHW